MVCAIYVWASAKMVLTLVFTRVARSESKILRENWTGGLSNTVKCGPSQSFLGIGEKNVVAGREISSDERLPTLKNAITLRLFSLDL